MEPYEGGPHDFVLWDSCDPANVSPEAVEKDPELQEMIDGMIDAAAAYPQPEGEWHMRVMVNVEKRQFFAVTAFDTAGELKQCIARKRRVLREFLNALMAMPDVEDRAPFSFNNVDEAESFAQALAEEDWEGVDRLLKAATLREWSDSAA